MEGQFILLPYSLSLGTNLTLGSDGLRERDGRQCESNHACFFFRGAEEIQLTLQVRTIAVATVSSIFFFTCWMTRLMTRGYP
jgi:hypothetical protein